MATTTVITGVSDSASPTLAALAAQAVTAQAQANNLSQRYATVAGTWPAQADAAMSAALEQHQVAIAGLADMPARSAADRQAKAQAVLSCGCPGQDGPYDDAAIRLAWSLARDVATT